MKVVPITKFHAQCLALLDQIDDEGLIVTKLRKAIVRIDQYHSHHAELIGLI